MGYHQTEIWRQQFLDEAIVGEMTGTQLQALPARLEFWENYKKRFSKEGGAIADRTVRNETNIMLQFGWWLQQPGWFLPTS